MHLGMQLRALVLGQLFTRTRHDIGTLEPVDGTAAGPSSSGVPRHWRMRHISDIRYGRAVRREIAMRAYVLKFNGMSLGTRTSDAL
jgi:hypothetical protein